MPLLFRNVTICWPVASLTMFALVRLRKARFASRPAKPGRNWSGLTMRVSIRIASLNFAAGTPSAAWPPAGKSYSRRKSAIQELIRRGKPPRSPLVAEKVKRRSSVPKPSSKILFQL